jgi:hypothetical protein
MKKKNDSKKSPDQKADDEKEVNPPGYPIYPDNEDIYRQNMEEDIDPEDVLEDVDSKEDEFAETDLEKAPIPDMYSGDLDVPGSELDDEEEIIGNEDEENNFYSSTDDEDT